MHERQTLAARTWRKERGNFVLPLALFAAAFALYLSTLAPGMLRGDSGEFQWAMASLNVAHATGYPLFTLLGYGWLQLPLAGSAAWRLNLLSALFGALAVAIVFILARALTRRTDAALVGALFLAVAPVFWLNASILEVYTLNTFFLALILYLLWRWAQQPAARTPLYLAFFVLGLALAHHRLSALTLPAILVYIWLTDRKLLANWRVLLLALLVLPGLALYIYVPLRLLAAGASLHYAIYDIILGQEFSGSLLREFHPLKILWEIPAQNFQAGLSLALLGAGVMFRRARNLLSLLLLVYLTNVGFALIYTVPDVEVFLTPSFVVIALWIATGAGFALEWLGARVRPIYALCLLLIFAALGLTQYENVRAGVAAEAGAAETRARAILAANLPRGALLEIDWETATALRFMQTTAGARRDLDARLIKLNQRDEYWWVLQNVAAGRAVFTESGVKWVRAAAGYRTQPVGNDLAQIVRESVESVAVGEQVNDRVALAAMQSDKAGLTLYWQVRRPLERDVATYAHFFDADGQPLGQQDHAACCEAVYNYRTSEWEVGRTIADHFRPMPEGAAFLRVGMYEVKNDELEPYGRTLYWQVQPLTPNPDAHRLEVQFGESIAARAYQLSSDGKNWKFVLDWEARATVGREYTIFVHVLDANGKIVAQVDREPLGGVYPTLAWRAGQSVRDTYSLPARQEDVEIEFGLYDTRTGKRLARADGKGDAVVIALK